MRLASVLAGAVLAAAAVAPGTAHADKIKNPTAIFAGLDKITGRIINFEAQVDETVQFGALQITPRVCYTRPPTEPVNTTAFLEVDEVTFTNEARRIFGGWVFASSPGLHGIEHPIYDVWLTGCKGGTVVIPDAPDPDKVPPAAQPQTSDRRQRQQPQTQQTGLPAGTPPVVDGGGRIGVSGPAGVPVEPRRPSQSFFPARSNTPVPNYDPLQNNPNR